MHAFIKRKYVLNSSFYNKTKQKTSRTSREEEFEVWSNPSIVWNAERAVFRELGCGDSKRLLANQVVSAVVPRSALPDSTHKRPAAVRKVVVARDCCRPCTSVSKIHGVAGSMSDHVRHTW